MSESKIDGYWLRMGHLAIDALMTANRVRSLSPSEIAVIAEWFGYLLSEVHDMGMRLGEAKGKYIVRMREIQ